MVESENTRKVREQVRELESIPLGEWAIIFLGIIGLFFFIIPGVIMLVIAGLMGRSRRAKAAMLRAQMMLVDEVQRKKGERSTAESDNGGSFLSSLKGRPFAVIAVVFAGIILLVVLGQITGYTKGSTSSSRLAQPEVAPPPIVPESYPRVFIGGIERGECMVPKVNLWSNSDIGGSAYVINSVEGCVGLPVEIIDETTNSGRRVVKVRTYGANVGKEGWVMDSLIIE